MLLDIEVAARPGISIHQARRNLDAFQDAAAGFLHTSHRVDVLAFLAWLEAAAAEEGGLDVAAPDVNHEAVQLLTVHASKGLEWDVVFVPGPERRRLSQQPGFALEQRERRPAVAAARGPRRSAAVGPGPAGPKRLAGRGEGLQSGRPGSRRGRGTPARLCCLHPGEIRAVGFQRGLGRIPGRNGGHVAVPVRAGAPRRGRHPVPTRQAREPCREGPAENRSSSPPSCTPPRWRRHRCRPKVR